MLGNTGQQFSANNPDNIALCVCNSGDYPLETRPDLLAFAMRIISAWSIVDSYITRSFANMVGDGGAPAIAMYESLGSTQTRHTTLRAAAKVCLSPMLYGVLEALLFIYNKRVKFRNKVAHHLWGYSSAAPDGVVLLSPTEVSELDSGDLLDEPDFSKMTVYERADFESALASAEALSAWFHDFYFVVINHVAADDILHRLLEEPDLQSGLQRFLPEDQNNP